MGSRLLAPGLALGALLADAVGLHGIALWLVLLALPAAAAASFTGISDGLAGKGTLAGVTASLALVLLVLGSAVREAAPRGGPVPTPAISAVVAALLCYSVPGILWLLEPLRPVRTARPSPRASRA
jgi:hypothetical protein